MKNVGVRTVLLLILSTPWLAASQAADPDSAKLNEEMSKQERIYRSEGEKTLEGYTVDRGLSIYSRGLPSEFARSLASLGPSDRWLDIGAGKGQAILDYYTPDYDLAQPEGRKRRGAKAQVVAMSIEDRRTPQWRQTAASLEVNQLQYLTDKRLREYSVAELGQFQVITDVVGGFSYTENLSLFMEKALAFLATGGSFYSILQDVRWEDGTNRPHYQGSPFLTEIVNADGSELKICSWLKRITCAQVTCESRSEWEPSMEAFRVHKVCDDVTVPALTPLHYQAGTPPERRFQLDTK